MPVDKVKRYDEAYNKIRRDYESRRQKAYNKYKETERRLLEERDRKVKRILAEVRKNVP